ncbi:hypothetical protein C8F01DRAFT_1017912 [Mycena amicta]|nr:hypothetical protein C8F01DRAFT_1017912 [Mycena amicta]
MPCKPQNISVVITIRTLEAFRRQALRCPRLGVQAFVRSLCDLHHVAPVPYLATQFRDAFDVYLSIREEAENRVKAALFRDSPDWRLLHACPACLYKLKDEPELEIPMIFTMDGNNSLKRYPRRSKVEYDADAGPIPGVSTERTDTRAPPGDYYIPRDEVDKWAKEGLEILMEEFTHEGGADGEGEEEPCDEERWKNMREEVTSRALAMWDETGIVPALCRHSFVLVVVDMVKSGEMLKYGFAIVDHLVRVLGPFGMGYDIGCSFGAAVRKHPVLRQVAHRCIFIVGSFHGPGHSRRCQVKYLPRYRTGFGLEPMENCESYFSKSNALAATTRYAMRFRRQQAIVNYMKHTDTADAYGGITNLFTSKYKEVARVLGTKDALRLALSKMGVSTDEVEGWLEKEKEFLASVSKEPLEETLRMDYYNALLMLYDRHLQKSLEEAVGVLAPGDYHGDVSVTQKMETQARHARDALMKVVDMVGSIELQLRLSAPWQEGDVEFEAAKELVRRRKYQRAVDELQGLVVSRLLELNKCHMSGTGYRMRTHIATALRVRSTAVQASLARFNAAAVEMGKRTLDWNEVVQYSFMSDFDLLREGRTDITRELWIQPKARAAMDAHFKILRAEEERVRLNIEIRRFITHIRDEDAFLRYHERRLMEEDQKDLAHQVSLYRVEHSRFNPGHIWRLVQLKKLPEFNGTMVPGEAVSQELCIPVVPMEVDDPAAVGDQRPGEEELDSGESADDEDEIVESMDGLMRATDS